MKTITQKEIARRAGVSQTAASMVLSGRQNAAISDETRRKILSVARKSGYRMRFVRQAYTQTRTIAYLLDMKNMDTDVSQAYYQRFIGTLSQTLDDSGYSLAVVSHTTVERSIDTLIERKFDGVISGRDIPDQILRTIDVPVVFINRPAPDAARFSSVMPDNRGGILSAVRRLYGLGHRAIAFFGMTPLNAHTTERLAGYRDALASLGLNEVPGYVVTPPCSDGTYEEVSAYARDAIVSWRSHAAPPSAVVTMGDVYALPLLSHAINAGMRVPGDVSIIGFDNTIACQSSIPQLSSIEQDIEAMSRTAAGLLSTVLRDRKTSARTVIIPTTLKERGSLGPHTIEQRMQ